MRIYYNTNNGKTAVLNTATAIVHFNESGKDVCFKTKFTAGAFLNKHGYKLICIR